MRIRALIAVAAASTTFTAFIAGAGAQAPPETRAEEEMPNVPEMGLLDEPNEAELADIAVMAEAEGIEMDEAIKQFGWQDNFALAVAQIHKKNPRDFAGADATNGPRIGFTRGVPAHAKQLISALNEKFDIDIETLTNRGISEDAALKALTDVHGAAMKTRGVKAVVSGYDYASGKIEAEIAIGEPARGPQANPNMADQAVEAVEAARARVLQNMQRAATNLPDHVTFSAEIHEVNSLHTTESFWYHFGGESINGCTSAFGTRASSATSGTRGILTAAHCSDNQSDDGARLYYKKGIENLLGDFQWHTGAMRESDDFYSGSSYSTEVNRRDVGGLIGHPVTGNSVCRNGTTSHKDCQTIVATGVCHSVSGRPTVCNQIVLKRHLSGGGDSGGPVFWGNIPYGIHRGKIYWNGEYREVSSRADFVTRALGVYIAAN